MAMRPRAATIFLGLLLPSSPLIAQQLFPNGAGWYRESGYRSTAAQRRLYWTSDWGAHWQDITPPIPDRYQLGQIFFLDRSRGWVFLVPFCGARNGFANPDPHAKVKLAITADSGKSWTTSDVGLLDYTRPLSLGDGLGCVSFADAEHGWARIGFADPQGAYDLLLLATKDGGRNWTSLSHPPSKLGCMRFSNAKDGWMTDPSSGTLRVWRTQDGGQTWLDVSPTVPDTFGRAFGDYGIEAQSRKGVSVAGYFMSPSGDQVLLWLTKDEGVTWKREIALPTRGGWNHDALTVVGSSIVRGELSGMTRQPKTDADAHDIYRKGREQEATSRSAIAAATPWVGFTSMSYHTFWVEHGRQESWVGIRPLRHYRYALCHF